MRRVLNFGLKGFILFSVIITLIFLQQSKGLFAKEPSIDLRKIFPATEEEITLRSEQAILEMKELIKAIIEIPHQKRTFGNTAKKLDELSALSNFSTTITAIHALEMVSPEESIRNEAHKAIIRMQEFAIDEISNNFALYQAFKGYYEGNAYKEDLSPTERYFLEETLIGFKQKGFDLPEEQQEQIKALQKELGALSLEFSSNIAADQTTIFISKENLEGISEDFISTFPLTSNGYEIVLSPPNYTKILENCSVSNTRKIAYEAYMTRAYPANDLLLKQIVAKRDELAHLMGFPSYAAYDLQNQMVKTPERAREFIDTLTEKIQPKVMEEFRLLTTNLPSSVALSTDEKIYPWDRAFLETQYKKENFQIDEQKIAEYFQVEKTIQSLFSVYEKFFSLEFRLQKAEGLWHKDVLKADIYSKENNQLLGCLLLDLFPRPFKYSHACDINIIPSTYENGVPNIALSLVIANFPKPLEGKPSLLQRTHVRTFFHELGHALHDILGRTSLASMSGTQVKTDFVEMPSQMLEEWLSDKEILKSISSHYETGTPIPDAWVDSLCSLKNVFSGLATQQQLYFARLSLDLFEKGAEKDPFAISQELATAIRPNFVFSPKDRMYASFNHLTGYGAKYYGYMWAKVFALDLFQMIKEAGLLNPVIGRRYTKEVIGQGGSVDPNILLENFLGREPNNTAFLQDIGVL